MNHPQTCRVKHSREIVQFRSLHYRFEEKNRYGKLSTQNLILTLLEQGIVFLDRSTLCRDSVTLEVTLSVPIEVNLPSYIKLAIIQVIT